MYNRLCRFDNVRTHRPPRKMLPLNHLVLCGFVKKIKQSAQSQQSHSFNFSNLFFYWHWVRISLNLLSFTLSFVYLVFSTHNICFTVPFIVDSFHLLIWQWILLSLFFVCLQIRMTFGIFENQVKNRALRAVRFLNSSKIPPQNDCVPNELTMCCYFSFYCKYIARRNRPKKTLFKSFRITNDHKNLKWSNSNLFWFLPTNWAWTLSVVGLDW